MRKILIAAWLLTGASAWASGIEFWVLGGETLSTSGKLGTDSCYGIAVTNLKACGAYVTYPDQYSLGNAWHFGFRGGFNSGEHLGYEVGYMYNRVSEKCSMPAGTPTTYLQCYNIINGAAVPTYNSSTGTAYHQIAFNGLYYLTGSDSKFRPFVTGGIGFTAYALAPGSSAEYGGANNEFAVNYGVGVKYRLSDKFGLRIDARQSATPRPSPVSPTGSLIEFGPSGWLLETEVSAGFGLYF